MKGDRIRIVSSPYFVIWFAEHSRSSFFYIALSVMSKKHSKSITITIFVSQRSIFLNNRLKLCFSKENIWHHISHNWYDYKILMCNTRKIRSKCRSENSLNPAIIQRNFLGTLNRTSYMYVSWLYSSFYGSVRKKK